MYMYPRENGRDWTRIIKVPDGTEDVCCTAEY